MKKLFVVALMAFGLVHAQAQTIDGRNFGIDGFAALSGAKGTNWYLANGTTGGAGGKVVYADNFSQLQAYLQSANPYIILVDHDITTGIKAYVDDLSTGHLCDKQDGSEGVETTYGERIMVASNKTLIGIGNSEDEAPLFSRITFVMQCTSNVIIRNCRFTMVGVPILKSGENKIVAYRKGQQKEVGDPDCIGIQADAQSAKTDWGGHIWIDHCTFFNGGAANKDRYDGLLDCKNNVQWLTFSYNHFMNHDKSCLFGKGDSDIFSNERTISFHHNFFENIQGSRLPLQRGSYLDYANNYMLGCEDGWDIRTGATAYERGCYFENTKSPIRSDRGGSLNICKDEGYDVIYKGCNNLMEGYTNIDGAKISKNYKVTASNWKPTDIDADYQLNDVDKTSDVPALARKYSGAGKIKIWDVYASSVPKIDLEEYQNAVSHQQATEGVYDMAGNKVTTTGVEGPSAFKTKDIHYYTLNGVEMKRPGRGLNIVSGVNESGKKMKGKVIVMR